MVPREEGKAQITLFNTFKDLNQYFNLNTSETGGNLSHIIRTKSGQDNAYSQRDSRMSLKGSSGQGAGRRTSVNTNRIFSQDLKFITTEEITEYRNIFDLYDKKGRGLLDRECFLKNLSSLYNYGDCIEKLKQNGFENAKDIRIDQFITMLKPFNAVVPEIVLNNLRSIYDQKYAKYQSNQLKNKQEALRSGKTGVLNSLVSQQLMYRNIEGD